MEQVQVEDSSIIYVTWRFLMLLCWSGFSLEVRIEAAKMPILLALSIASTGVGSLLLLELIS